MLTMAEQKSGKPLHVILLETAGLSVISVCVFYFAMKIFDGSFDKMKFLLPKPPPKQNKFSFEDHWAGRLPEAAQEVLDILRFPEVYDQYGAPAPKGILLYGLPGTGKTHFARMIADVTNATFFYASASQFDELFVGKGPQRVRNLFREAEESCKESFGERLHAIFSGEKLPKKKAVIFIDELDAIGNRNQSIHQSATHGTVSQLLTCLDGMTPMDNIFVIAATNNLKQIDPALRRSGRFDRVITMPLPEKADRLKILHFYLKSCPGIEKLIRDGTLESYATRTHGFAAADIKNLANEATLAAVQKTIHEKKEHLTGAQNPLDYAVTEEFLRKAFINVQTKLKQERSLPTDKTLPKTDDIFDMD